MNKCGASGIESVRVRLLAHKSKLGLVKRLTTFKSATCENSQEVHCEKPVSRLFVYICFLLFLLLFPSLSRSFYFSLVESVRFFRLFVLLHTQHDIVACCCLFSALFPNCDATDRRMLIQCYTIFHYVSFFFIYSIC